jgi:hypothetical protein
LLHQATGESVALAILDQAEHQSREGSKQSKAIKSNHTESKAIKSNQKQSKAIKSNQKQSKAIKSNQKQSKAIKRNHIENIVSLDPTRTCIPTRTRFKRFKTQKIQSIQRPVLDKYHQRYHQHGAYVLVLSPNHGGQMFRQIGAVDSEQRF